MVSIEEINSRRFEKATFGYKPDEVDEFLREVAIDYAALKNEYDENEKKIEVLVDKIREYKGDEDALKDALISAQRQGRLVIEEAKEQAASIIAQAQAQAQEILGGTQTQLENEKRSLEKMQIEVTKFKSNLLSLYKNHLDLITALPEVEYDEEEQEDTDAYAEEQDYEEPVAEDVSTGEYQAFGGEYDEAEAVTAAETEYASDEADSAFPSEEEQQADAEQETPAQRKFSDFSFMKNNSSKANVESKYGELKFGQNHQ